MARDDLVKSSAAPFILDSGTRNFIHPPSAQSGVPPHQSSSQWTSLQSQPLAHYPPSERLQPPTSTPYPIFASQPGDAFLGQIALQPSSTSMNNVTFYPKMHESSWSALHDSIMPSRSMPEAKLVSTATLHHSNANQGLWQRTVHPADLHRYTFPTRGAGPSGAGVVNQEATHQSATRSFSQPGRVPTVSLTKPSEVSNAIASHDGQGSIPLRLTRSLDTVTAISAMPKVAGVKRTREDEASLERTTETGGTGKSLERPSHQRQVSRKRICLPQYKSNQDSDEIQYLGPTSALTLSRSIPPSALVRSASSSSPPSRSTMYATSPETPASPGQPSAVSTPAWSTGGVESPPCMQDGAATRSSKQQQLMPCPGPYLQYVWDAIAKSVIPALPPSWDAKAFKEAMERSARVEDISFERGYYPFYAARYDPEGLARGSFEGRTQAELEVWFSMIRRWESENPEAVEAETRRKNEELRELFGN